MKEWLSLKSISNEYADIGERKLREFLGHSTHPLPARLVGGKLLVARVDLEQWLRSFPQAREAIDRVVEEIMAEMHPGGHYD
jgi:hypothetical protein